MKILLPVDGSSYSNTAINTLEALKLSRENEITVMTVVPEPTLLGGITVEKLTGTKSAITTTQEEEASELLQGPVQLLSKSGFKVESLVRRGNPAQEILKVADDLHASLIVMGAKGLTDYTSFNLGSVTQKVMKYSHASVMLAKKKTAGANNDLQQEDKAITMDQVLFATDGSKYADMAAQFLLDLPIPLQSQITVITVCQFYIQTLLTEPSFDLKIDKELLASLQSAEESEANKIIARNIQQFSTKGYKTTSLIMEGAASKAILKTASEKSPDIIVMGAKGLTGTELFLLGGVSERVARRAPCSVLIVKPLGK